MTHQLAAGWALSGAVSARVERFFGASRIKIDPQVTGVDNIPQARITVEQSISPDVTMTFVTNLHQAQQQVVQFEWNLSAGGRWSRCGTRTAFSASIFCSRSGSNERPKNAPAGRGRALKIEHSIIDGLRPVLERMLEWEEIRTIVPA